MVCNSLATQITTEETTTTASRVECALALAHSRTHVSDSFWREILKRSPLSQIEQWVVRAHKHEPATISIVMLFFNKQNKTKAKKKYIYISPVSWSLEPAFQAHIHSHYTQQMQFISLIIANYHVAYVSSFKPLDRVLFFINFIFVFPFCRLGVFFLCLFHFGKSC